MPTDPGQRKTLESQLQNYKRELYYSSVKTIERSLVVAAIVSFLYMFLVQCCPRIMNKAVVVIGTLALIILAITIIVYPS
jgi:tryptophan-rich sensory protein